jgi:site-specific DNA recombinase
MDATIAINCSRTRVGPTGLAGRGWRLPAGELEQKVGFAIAGMLDDTSALVAALSDAEIDADQIRAAVERASEWSRRLKSDPYTAAAETLLKRVVLRSDGFEIALSLDALAGERGERRGSVLTHFIPLRLQRRGVELRLVLDGQHASGNADPVLLKALARAKHWFEELRSGRATSLDELAQRAGVGKRYISQLLPLAFLSPRMVEAIATGRHPVDLTTDYLVRYSKLPHDWTEQEQRFLHFNHRG